MKLNIDKKAVGSRIRTIRLDRGLTLEEFGKFFNSNRSIVYNWEVGRTIANVERIKTICKLFDITRNELLYGSIDELIENNKELIYNQLNISKREFEILYNDIDELLYEEIDINSNSLFRDIVNYFKKCIDELKNKYIEKIKSILNNLDIDSYLEKKALFQVDKEENFYLICKDEIKSFVNIFIDNFNVIDMYNNILEINIFIENFEGYKSTKYFNVYLFTIEELEEIILKCNKRLEELKQLEKDE